MSARKCTICGSPMESDEIKVWSRLRQGYYARRSICGKDGDVINAKLDLARSNTGMHLQFTEEPHPFTRFLPLF